MIQEGIDKIWSADQRYGRTERINWIFENAPSWKQIVDGVRKPVQGGGGDV